MTDAIKKEAQALFSVGLQSNGALKNSALSFNDCLSFSIQPSYSTSHRKMHLAYRQSILHCNVGRVDEVDFNQDEIRLAHLGVMLEA